MTVDWKTPALAFLGLAGVLSLFLVRGARIAAAEFVVTADITSSRLGTAQLYFDSGASYSEAASARQAVPVAGERVTLSFPIPSGTYRALRLDPPEGEIRLVVHALSVADSRGQVRRILPLTGAVPGSEIATLTSASGAWEITTRPGATDAQVEFPLAPPVALTVPRWAEWGGSAAWVWLAGGLVAAAGWRLAQASTPPATGGQRIALGTALFLTVWGARLALIDRFGSDLPYWDQWDKEGMRTFVPWADGARFWPELFAPFNEHRVVPTALLNLLLLKIGGTWDARVQCVVNAAVLAGLVAWLADALGRRRPLGERMVLTWLLAALFALPLGWENILGGFQSQFTFLALFSVLGILGLVGATPGSGRWWAGLAAGAVAVVSMGSGFLWAVPGVGAAGLLALRGPGGMRRAAANTVAGAMIVALGLGLRASPASLAVLHARDAVEFVTYAARCLAWPWPDAPWLAPLLWLPWCVVLWRMSRPAAPGQSIDPTSVMLLAAGAWILLQAAAVAYGRGASPGLPPSRYSDLFVLGAVVNLACGLRLAQTPCWRVGVAVHLGAVVTGAVVLATTFLGTEIPIRAREQALHAASIRAYLDDRDLNAFLRRPLPFPDGPFLAHALDHPVLRPVLPASVGAPGVRATAVSRLGSRTARQAWLLLFAGLALFLVLLVPVSRHRSRLSP